MPISATGKAHEAGFTLIELLVVLSIMALALTFVTLALPSSQPSLHHEAEKWAARIAVARDNAISSAQPVSLVPSGRDFPLPAGVSVEPANQVIRFDGTGMADSDHRIMLVRGKERAIIRVSMAGDVSAEQ